MDKSPGVISLRTLAGPYGSVFTFLADRPGIIGRAANCEVCLLHEGVSRRHAMIVPRGDEWYIIDQGSTAGTFLNGVRLEPSRPTSIGAGDLLRVGPWTFRVVMGSSPSHAAHTIDDSTTAGYIERASTVGGRTLPADRQLKLLVECIAKLNDADEESALARAALESALNGSGYARGAVLKRLDGALGDGEVEVVAALRLTPGDAGDFAFSRELVKQASAGGVAVLTMDRQANMGQSVVDLRIHSALCAPVFLGESVEGYLYLDARGQESSVRADSTGFCEAVARAYGLAIANLKRIELERRQRSLQRELAAAREAQHFILPPAEAERGFIQYAMEMRPGQFVAGDLFDVVSLDDGRIAVCMGDVAGHGMAPAMLMAMTQSQLHAQVRIHSDPGDALRAVNRYVSEHAGAGRFVSLWLGVFSPNGELSYVDAGHGHWLVTDSAAPAHTHRPPGAIPLGIDPEHPYSSQSLRLSPGDRIVLYSDGVTEQRSPSGEQFGSARLAKAVSGNPRPRDDVRGAFDTMTAFAGGAAMDDDATVASIEYRGSDV